jgi:uncharacterized Zn finger protein
VSYTGDEERLDCFIYLMVECHDCGEVYDEEYKFVRNIKEGDE